MRGSSFKWQARGNEGDKNFCRKEMWARSWNLFSIFCSHPSNSPLRKTVRFHRYCLAHYPCCTAFPVTRGRHSRLVAGKHDKCYEKWIHLQQHSAISFYCSYAVFMRH
jgi:hypothetical protein